MSGVMGPIPIRILALQGVLTLSPLQKPQAVLELIPLPLIPQSPLILMLRDSDWQRVFNRLQVQLMLRQLTVLNLTHLNGAQVTPSKTLLVSVQGSIMSQ